MCVGLVPSVSPRLTPRTAGLAATLFTVAAAATVWVSDSLPRLARIDDLRAVASRSDGMLTSLTGWHWTSATVPIALAAAAAGGAVRHAAELRDRGWLVVAMVLMVGSQLHTAFWPSAYSPILTTASILRLGVVVIVAVAAVEALRRVAMEWAATLATERVMATRLADVDRLRADFTAMIGHELASPIATLRTYAAMLATGNLDGARQSRLGSAIEGEAQLLAVLVDDVRAASNAERVAFDLRPVPVELRPLLHAAAFARVLPGEHPVRGNAPDGVCVLADPERVAQVLRNLIGNARAYTPPGTPIEVRTVVSEDQVRVEVVDRGPEIQPGDEERIFGHYGRGNGVTDGTPGLGLGLYLSRRIVRAHGGELGVGATPGGGATFWFTLPIAP